MDEYPDYLEMEYYVVRLDGNNDSSATSGPMTFYMILRIPEEPTQFQENDDPNHALKVDVASEIQIEKSTSYLGETISGGETDTWRTSTGTAVTNPDWEQDFNTGKQGDTDTWYGGLGEARVHNMFHPEFHPMPHPLFAVFRVKINFTSDDDGDDIRIFNYYYLPHHSDESVGAQYKVEPCMHDSETNKWEPDLPMSAYHVNHIARGLYKMLFEACSPWDFAVCGHYADSIIIV